MMIEFLENDLKGNTLKLLRDFNLEKEQEVPVVSFEIEVSGISTGLVLVGEGKYKSALFLLYWAEWLTKFEPNRSLELTASLEMNKILQEVTVAHFGDELCDDAKNNPQTKHTTIRDLLTDGQVIVHINRK